MAVNPNEPWHWAVMLGDGTELRQYDADGTERGWKEVPHDRVVALSLVPARDGLHPVGVAIEEGLAPVFYRSKGAFVFADEATPSVPVELTVVGFARADGSRALCYCCEDGRVVLTDRPLV